MADAELERAERGGREREELVAEAEASYAGLLARHADVQSRFDARESRAEDLATIAALRAKISEAERENAEAETHRAQMQMELREKERGVFGAGAATLNADDGATVLDWMLKKPKPPAGPGRGGPPRPGSKQRRGGDNNPRANTTRM